MGIIRVKKQTDASVGTPLAGYVDLYVSLDDGVFKIKDEAGDTVRAEAGVNAVDTKANLDALAREEGKIYYATDTDRLYADDGTQLISVGEELTEDTLANLTALPRQTGAFYYATDVQRFYVDNGSVLYKIIAEPDLTVKADTDLSNLGATSINEDLIPQADKDLGSSASPWKEVHGEQGRFGNDFAGAYVQIGDDGGSEYVVKTNDKSDATVSQAMNFESGGTTAGTNDSGDARLKSGDTNPATTSRSGDVEIGSGAGGAGDSGDTILDTGSSTATRGKIRIKGGSEGTAGQVLKSVDTDGGAEWADDTTGVDASDTTANLTALARVAGKLYYSTDDKTLLLDNGTELTNAGGGSTPSITRTQVTHGFAVLDAIYHNGVSFQKAQADNEATLAQFVVTSVKDADNFTAAKFGEIDAPAHGLVVGDDYFLSNGTAGASTNVEPNSFSCPLFYVEDANTIILQVYRPAGPAQTGGGVNLVDTTANLNALPREEGKLYYSTDEDVLKADDGTTLNNVGGGGGSSLEIEDESSSVDAAVSKINFLGAGVTAVQNGAGNVDVTIPGGGGGGTLQRQIIQFNYALFGGGAAATIDFGLTANTNVGDNLLDINSGGAGTFFQAVNPNTFVSFSLYYVGTSIDTMYARATYASIFPASIVAWETDQAKPSAITGTCELVTGGGAGAGDSLDFRFFDTVGGEGSPAATDMQLVINAWRFV